MPEFYRLITRDKHRLLDEMMRAMAGRAHISFEGDLSHYNFNKIAGFSDNETPVLARNTIWPRQDFAAVPLTPETIPIIWRALPGRVPHNILHILIERDGKLVFSACDNFDPECVVCSIDVPRDLLERLRLDGIIESYTVIPNTTDNTSRGGA